MKREHFFSMTIFIWSQFARVVGAALFFRHHDTVSGGVSSCQSFSAVSKFQILFPYGGGGGGIGSCQLGASNRGLEHKNEQEQEATSAAIALDKNAKYIGSLLDNLASTLDKYILSGSPESLIQAQNILKMISSQSMHKDLVQRAQRMVQRAGVVPVTNPNSQQHDQLHQSKKEIGRSDSIQRQKEAEQRRQWEASRLAQEEAEKRQQLDESSSFPKTKKSNHRSALGKRQQEGGKPDLFLGQVDQGLGHILRGAQDKVDFEKSLVDNIRASSAPSSSSDALSPSQFSSSLSVDDVAVAKVAELVARAGAASAFDGETLGIGGLDDVLAEVKRRVWTPLAAPPRLLQELGICPVRGLLLYGRPGCGKTLLARQLGQILSPLRPITVVSGPEILDKFVGSSEKNLREIFDNPPDIYEFFRIGQPDEGQAIARAALHVVIMDEFDAIARTRGGRGGSGDGQGDAGVARDSVVNQLLAKMDGVEPLVVPTMVIGLTNKRSLIDQALLRPGRFEVQVEVPPPRTVEQRVSIFKVHTSKMHQAGRLYVRDAPVDSPAARQQDQLKYAGRCDELLPTYEELLQSLAEECQGFSGALLAGVTRAAASHALERAVDDFMEHVNDASILHDCVVMQSDFDAAIQDVRAGMGDSDWKENKDDGGGKTVNGPFKAKSPVDQIDHTNAALDDTSLDI